MLSYELGVCVDRDVAICVRVRNVFRPNPLPKGLTSTLCVCLSLAEILILRLEKNIVKL